MNAKKSMYIGLASLIFGGALLSACNRTQPVVEPIKQAQIQSVEDIVADPSSGLGCMGLYEMTGAYNAMSYNDFVENLQKENPNSNGLSIYFDGETPHCGITASPSFGYNPVDREYSFRVPFYEGNNLEENIDAGAVRIVPQE